MSHTPLCLEGGEGKKSSRDNFRDRDRMGSGMWVRSMVNVTHGLMICLVYTDDTRMHIEATNQELGDGCHTCELQSTSSQPVSSFIYPQGRSVHVPTGNPTPRVDPGPAGGVTTANKYSTRAWRWMPFL